MAGETSDHKKLPEDLLIEFFLRSSVKLLLQAKCVCKQWYALIRNTNFVLKHLQYQKRHDKGRLLLQYFRDDNKQYNYAYFDDETLLRNSYYDLDHFQLPDKIPLHIEGPVNGLYCLFNGRDRIILWNPALMEVRILPSPQTQFFPHNINYWSIIGFGIDPSSNDYKLVLIRGSLGKIITLYVTVYNLTTNTWKLLNLGDFHIGEMFLHNSTDSSFQNGSYYWCTSNGKVIAFDMAEETFRHILGPDLTPPTLPDMFHYYCLAMYNCKVAIVQVNCYSVDVSVMLEEGIWIKQFSHSYMMSYASLVGLWKNDELFVFRLADESSEYYSNYQVFLCNASAQETKKVGPKGNSACFKTSIYYESLVSVDFGTQLKGKCASLSTISNFLHFC